MNTTNLDGRITADDTGKSSPMDGLAAVAAAAAPVSTNNDATGTKKRKRKQSNGQPRDPSQDSAARARRLEQNRRAAIESRKRKKLMIAELQRSVAFYSKANENLKKSNEELEEYLLIAKEKLNQKDGGDDTSSLSKTPEQESVSKTSSPTNEQQVAPAVNPAPSSVASLNQVGATDADQARVSAIQATFENMGYPAAAARSAASCYSQMDKKLYDAIKPSPVPVVAVGTNAKNLVGGVAESSSPTIEQQAAPIVANPMSFASVNQVSATNADQARVSTTEATFGNIMGYPIAALYPATNFFSHTDKRSNAAEKPDAVPTATVVGSDAYIQSLEQYAMQKTAAAKAATLAASTAMNLVHWHKMMKKSGQNAQTSIGEPLPVTSTNEEK